MEENKAWIWRVIACPECGEALRPGENTQSLTCSNPVCGYCSRQEGRVFNLLPSALDMHQRAENDFRVNIAQKYSHFSQRMDATQYEILQMLNVITYYAFTSQYHFFRDFFARRYALKGRGLEIGGAKGQQSGFIKLFYPQTAMITSDVAPVNVRTAEKLARFVDFQTDYFVMADAERLPFLPNSFDFLFSSGMLHHLGDIRQALKKGYEILKPGGKWYIVNELSIAPIFQWFWNSRWGDKGRWARKTGIREESYALKTWQRFFREQSFQVVDMHFYRNPKHKMLNWSRAAYYALLSKLPVALLKAGIPCEVNFVLQKTV